MKQLSLLRHAKALPGSLRQEDKARALSPRGAANARALGEVLRKQSFMPDVVLCSSAVRTRETLRCLQEGHGNFTPQIVFEDALYHASADEILEACAEFEEAEHILIIGHNPGMAELYARLKNTGLESYPTCTLVHFNLVDAQEIFRHQAREDDSHLVPSVA